MLNLSYSAIAPTPDRFGSVKETFRCVTIGLTVLSIASLAGFGQASSSAHSFAITGHPGTAPVIQIGGKSYVSIEDITRLARGSLSFKADQIVLTLAAPIANALPVSSPPKQGFSREFLTSAIEAMAVIRELRIEIANAIQNNYPLSADWIADQSRKADTSLALASAAISTDDDRSGYSLLTGQYANVRKFRDNFLVAKSQARYIDPSSVDSDPLNRQIMSCTHALQAMAAENRFWDEPSCH
jgi:hypothetical protein